MAAGRGAGRLNASIRVRIVSMTNHYHLLVETPDGNLSKGMRHLIVQIDAQCSPRNRAATTPEGAQTVKWRGLRLRTLQASDGVQ